MAPVIRISDEVFRKLQLISEPLVDTPNAVIDRLLDEAINPARNGLAPAVRTRATPSAPLTQTHPMGRPADIPGVFLAPANQENIRTTLARSVVLSALDSRLDEDTLDKLREFLQGKTEFRCWAMTSSSRGSFDKMRIGDRVLFTPKGTGRFTYGGTVSGKIESQALGDLLWPVTPNRPWSLVYFLDNVERINLSKERLVVEFGYARGFPVYGITRVSPQRLASAVARRGSLEAVIDAAAIKRAT